MDGLRLSMPWRSSVENIWQNVSKVIQPAKKRKDTISLWKSMKGNFRNIKRTERSFSIGLPSMTAMKRKRIREHGLRFVTLQQDSQDQMDLNEPQFSNFHKRSSVQQKQGEMISVGASAMSLGLMESFLVTK